MTKSTHEPLAASAPLQLPLPAEGDWFVLHTRSRQEKVLLADLIAMHIGVYLPLSRQVKFHGKKKVRTAMPVFPGYVFLRGSVEQAYQADRTKRVVNIIKVADQRTLDEQIRQIHLALTREAPLDPYPYLTKGVPVEVTGGPFRGLRGVVEDRTTMDRLILKIDMLGRALSLEIEGSLLEPIGAD